MVDAVVPVKQAKGGEDQKKNNKKKKRSMNPKLTKSGQLQLFNLLL